MKRIVLIIGILLLALSAHAQESEKETTFEDNRHKIEQFKEKYRNTDNVTTIEIGSTMTNMMAVKLFEAGNDESAQLMRSIESIDIVAENAPGKSHIKTEMFALPDKCEEYTLITSIEKDGELTKFYFCSHPHSENREFLMLTRSYSQRVVLYITGSFSVSDISALSTLSKGIKQDE
ncbi:MAG: DUF4252 domain-containing protein [Rikenellaceae bacterium]